MLLKENYGVLINELLETFETGHHSVFKVEKIPQAGGISWPFNVGKTRIVFDMGVQRKEFLDFFFGSKPISRRLNQMYVPPGATSSLESVLLPVIG